MKVFQAFYNSIIFVAIINCVLCNKEKNKEAACPVPRPGRETGFTYDHDQSVSRLCFDELAGRDSALETLQDALSLAKTVCLNRPPFQECLQRQASRLEDCQNVTILQVFNIYSDLLKMVLENGCSGDGENLAQLLYGKANSGQNETVEKMYGKCLVRIANALKPTIDRKMDATIILFHAHRKLSLLKECLLLLPLGPEYKTTVESTVHIIIRDMKCVHPTSGSLAPCSSVAVAELNTSSICRGAGTQKVVSYDLLEETVGRCLYALLTGQSSGNLTVVQEETASFCSFRNQLSVGQCLDEATMKADLCFEEREFSEFGSLRKIINVALDSACEDSGRRLADVLTEVQRLKSLSPHRHLARDCIQAAREGVLQSSESKSNRFYRQLETFNVCFVSSLQGNEAIAGSARWLLGEVMSKAECVHPHTNATVRCQTIVNI